METWLLWILGNCGTETEPWAVPWKVACGALQGSVEVIYIRSLEVPLSHQPIGMSQMADRGGSLNPNIWSTVST